MKKANNKTSWKGNALLMAWIFFLPIFMYGQKGINDSTFNTSDTGNNSIFKGTDNSVKFSVAQSNSKKVVIAGDFTTYNGTPSLRIARLLESGDIDPNFHVGNGLNGTVTGLVMSPDNKVIVIGNFNMYNNQMASGIVRINTNGDKDNNFNTGTGFNGSLTCIALQTDGKILVGGNFTKYNNKDVKGLVRLNKSGTIDNTFNGKDTSYATISKIAVQQDGKIVVGYQNAVIRRLTANGITDGTFPGQSSVFIGHHPQLETMAVRSDGKVLIGGVSFQAINGVDGFLVQLEQNGERDTTFNFPFLYRSWIHTVTIFVNDKILVGGSVNVNPDAHIQTNFIALVEPDGSFNWNFFSVNTSKEIKNVVYTFTADADGRLYVGGFFKELNTYTVNNFTRLEMNGVQDIFFNKTTGANGAIKTMALLPDGKIMIGGNFSAYQYYRRNRIARLLKNGKLDTGFDPSMGANGPVNALALQPDGKVLVGGSFTSFDNRPGSHLVRLDEYGNYDNTFHVFNNWDPNVEINDILVLPDGKIMVGGRFTQIEGLPYQSLVRLNSDGSIDTTYKRAFPFSIIHKLTLLPSGQLLAAGSQSLRVNTDGSIDSTFQELDAAEIFTIALQPDGKIVTGSGGQFVQFSYYGYVNRFNANGTKDTAFTPGITNRANYPLSVQTVGILSNGEILAGGRFAQFNNVNANNVILLDSNGTVDPDFTGDANDAVYTSKILAGKALLGGAFNKYNGVARNGINRVLFFFGLRPQKRILPEDEAPTITDLYVYPNPTAGNVTIDGLQPGNSLIITSVNGSIVHKEIVKHTTQTVDVSSYANGIYFVTRIQNQKIKVERLVVNK